MKNIIDFDEASREWRKNKKTLKNGCFSYKCRHISKKNKYCTNNIFDEENGLCKYHCNKELLNSNILDFFTSITDDDYKLD